VISGSQNTTIHQIQVGFGGMQAAKTWSYRAMWRFPLAIALCSHKAPTVHWQMNVTSTAPAQHTTHWQMILLFKFSTADKNSIVIKCTTIWYHIDMLTKPKKLETKETRG